MLRMNGICQKHLSDETKLQMICGDSTRRFYSSEVKLAWGMRKVMRKVKDKLMMMRVIFMFNNTVTINLNLHLQKLTKKYMLLVL